MSIRSFSSELWLSTDSRSSSLSTGLKLEGLRLSQLLSLELVVGSLSNWLFNGLLNWLFILQSNWLPNWLNWLLLLGHCSPPTAAKLFLQFDKLVVNFWLEHDFIATVCSDDVAQSGSFSSSLSESWFRLISWRSWFFRLRFAWFLVEWNRLDGIRSSSRSMVSSISFWMRNEKQNLASEVYYSKF